MSELNTDRDVVVDGRREALPKEVAAPLRDQIVDKLYKKLEKDNIGEKVAKLWNGAIADRAEALKRQQTYLKNWDSHTIADTSGTFDGSSQLHIPMPLIVCKTLHARYIQALFGFDPPFHTKARNEASMERVQTVSDTMRYSLSDYTNHYKGVEEVVDRWIWDWVTTGTGILKQRWEVQYTRFIDVEMVEKPGAPIFKVDETGKEVAIPTTRMVEQEVKRTKKCFDGAIVELVNLEDFNQVGSNDPDQADAVMERVKLTASEMWTLADRKIFKRDVVEAIIDAGEDKDSGSLQGAVKDQRAANSGKASSDSEQDLDRYEIIEAYLKVDVDGSGITSDVIVWVHLKTRKLLRATYLHRVNKAGERPYAKIDFHPRKDQEFAAGMVELMYPLSKELDAMHNLKIDFGLVSVMPFGFYRATSGLEPTTIQLEPGALIPLDNPQTDVYFPNLGNRTMFGEREEAAIDAMIQRLTGVNEMSMGMMTSQGATRTATGARVLSNEMASNMDVFQKRLNRGWKKFLKYHLHMLQQRIPAGLSYRLSGDDGKDYWKQIRSADDIAGDFDIEVSPNSSTSNAGIQQADADQILQLTANPLDIQLGAITVANRYEALKNWYQSRGIKDWGRYVTKPQGYERQMTPEEEANRILRGIEVQVRPEMDHEGFIAYVDMFMAEDELLGQFPVEAAALLEIQRKKHIQMVQALQQMRAQAANAAQMQQNAQMSAQQTAPAQIQAPGPGPAPQGQQPVAQ